MKEFIYLDIHGLTASFKVPQVYQGFLISLPLPPYSTILGILSRMAGRMITPEDTRIGFRYTSEGVGKDLETYHRWKRQPSGSYSYDKTAVRGREVHYNPRLEIILDNTDLLDELSKPKRFITLGRSQDVATINALYIDEGEEIVQGKVENTFVRLEDTGRQLVNGMLFNLPESFDYTKDMVRMPQNISRYLAILDNEDEIKLPNLYKVGYQVFYLHKWSGENPG